MGTTITEAGSRAAPESADAVALPDVSLVVVATNERVELPAFMAMIDAFRAVFHDAGLRAVFIIVDDGVGGEFWEAAQALCTTIPEFRAIRFRRTFGESVALRIAASRARAPIVITNTWYIQVRPEAAVEAVKLLRGGVDYVAARRTQRVDSALARLQSWGFNHLTKILTGVAFHDLNCSFRGFRRDVIETIHFHGDLFRFVPVLALGQGYRVQEMDVVHVAERGPSTFLNFSLYLRRFLDIFSLFFLLKFIRKPLRFFGLTGFFLFLIGAAIGIWLVLEKFFAERGDGIRGVGMLDRPATIVSVLLMVLGSILLSIGLIGEIIIFTQGRQLSDYHIESVLSGASAEDEKRRGNRT